MSNTPSSRIYLFAKNDRTITSGWQAAPYRGKYVRVLVSKAGNFVKEKLGGLAWNDPHILLRRRRKRQGPVYPCGSEIVGDGVCSS